MKLEQYNWSVPDSNFQIERVRKHVPDPSSHAATWHEVGETHDVVRTRGMI